MTVTTAMRFGRWGRFGSTCWTLLRLAAQESPSGRAALDRFCREYREIVYVMFRAQCRDPETAQDLTQDFFARKVLTRALLRNASRSRGKFRHLLRQAVRFTLIDFLRGPSGKQGQQDGCALDRARLTADGERLYLQVADPGQTPEELFHRAWFLTLLDRVYAQLREDYVRRGQGALFDALADHLPGARPSRTYEEIAALFGVRPATIRQNRSRLLKSYRRSWQREARRSIPSPEERAEIFGLLMERTAP